MTALAADMAAAARQHPAGRIALALIWVGLLIATCGLWQLHVELSRQPLAAVVCWACVAGQHNLCLGHCDCCGDAA